LPQVHPAFHHFKTAPAGRRERKRLEEYADVVAVLPVKELKHTKSRLSAVLSPSERRRLTLTLLVRTITTLKSAGVGSILVLSPDEQVLSLAKTFEVKTLREKRKGLNRALMEATDWAADHRFAAILVLPSDLPFINQRDVRAILNMADGNRRIVVIAPDRERKGTNALLVKPPGLLRYSFGAESFQIHRRQALEQNLKCRVYSSPSVAMDVDTPRMCRLLLKKGFYDDKDSWKENRIGPVDPDSRDPAHPTGR
jgi:2-phospho-L-lactate/phosphoenolpyruvate guanylyltransferase